MSDSVAGPAPGVGISSAPSEGGLESGSFTAQGPRENNEDRYLARQWPDGALLVVVADGMGGHNAGEAAAERAVSVFEGLLRESLPSEEVERYDRLLGAFQAAHEKIVEEGNLSITTAGMGATAVAAVITPGECLHLHSGDCRLYHFRKSPDSGRYERQYVTRDHTIVQVLLELGQIQPGEVATHPMRSRVTASLGGSQHGTLTVEPKWENDFPQQESVLRLEPGDVLILSSDGFHGAISEEKIAELVGQHAADPKELAKQCVQAALGAGGTDNVTVIAVRWAPGPGGEERPAGRADADPADAGTNGADERGATDAEPPEPKHPEARPRQRRAPRRKPPAGQTAAATGAIVLIGAGLAWLWRRRG